jgi:predicted phage terminase large subunit-like protein
MISEFTRRLETGTEGVDSPEGRRKTRSMLDWARYYLPEHFRIPPSRMHHWLGEELDKCFHRRGRHLNVLAPRGAAKSTIGSLAYPLRAALEEEESYIWLLSDTRSQAHAHLENLKIELTENHRLSRDYPESWGKGPIWRRGAVVLRNGVAIEAYGTGQKLRGRRWREHRPSLIICDDLQNDRHMLSPEARKRSRDWFHGTVLKAGNRETHVLQLATALHRSAIAMELTEKPGWISRTFQAIEQWPENLGLWETWEAIYTDRPGSDEGEISLRRAREFYETHRPAMDAGAVVLWPEMEDLYTLMKMRVESGRTTFEREKQNSPISPELCEWPESYFDETIWFERMPTELRVKTIALDPSKGRDDRRGDYSALVRLGLDRQGIYYVEAELARRPVDEIVDAGVEHCRRFDPDVFGVESNQFQELLRDHFQEAFRTNGLPGLVPYPIRNFTNKRVRIRRLGPLLSRRRIKFRADSPGTRLLVEQLREFPAGDHDDGPDALEMAVRLANRWIREETSFEAEDGLGDHLPLELDL